MPAPKVEEAKKEEPEPEVVKHLKGPRPKGLKKFKAVVEKQPEIPVEELSENQKRKIEQAKLKKEEEQRQLVQAQLQAEKKAYEAELQRKKQIELEKLAQQKMFEEE